MLDNVREKVAILLNNEESGHGMDHIDRVYLLANKFAVKENADKYIVSLASLLHDVDDYKIVGLEQSKLLINAKKIMKEENIDNDVQNKVLDIIANMGYSKYLKGIRPNSLEGKIVSDADMCEAIGAVGIIRSIIYALSDKGNKRIFDKNIFPNVNITSNEYNGINTTHDTDGVINHFFEKSLKLKGLMLTESGKEEALTRHNLLVSFLKQFFIEENVPNWTKYLEKYLKEV